MRSEVKVLPEAFLNRLHAIVPSQKWDQIANTFSEPKPTTFRVNTLKTNAETVRETLGQSGFRSEPVSWYSDAFVLKSGRLRELQETQSYREGEIYVQALSSMVPVMVLDPKPGETILDLTAAPGSKTTQIASLMRGEGKIVANDNNKVRFFRLKSNIELQGASSVTLSLKHGESFGRMYPEQFDRVLLDAPCSAEGRFNVREPASYRYWKEAKVREMARKQRRLLLSGLSALKPGGVLVYSTCTFAPEENEEIIDWALQKSNGNIQVEKIALPFSNHSAGLAAWAGKSFHPLVKQTIRILPNNLMEGFFIAKLRKNR